MHEDSQILEQLRQGRPVVLNTRGCSMEPLLHQGRTQVAVEPLNRELQIGELPLFLRQDGKLVIHRVVGKNETSYHTRGDNCIDGETIPRENARGLVTRIYRGNRTLSVTDPGYRAYVCIWIHTAWLRIPCRRAWKRLRSAAGRMLRRGTSR